MRVVLVTVVVLLCALPGVAQAGVHTKCSQKKLLTQYSAHYYAVQKEQGKSAPGRNIRKWGLSLKRPSGCQPIAKSLRILRSMRFAGAQLLTPTSPYRPPAGTATLRATGAPLATIAQCESGGSPKAVSPDGTYRGKYQFDYGTWQSVGGSGDPAAAPEWEQDQRAARLYAQRGGAPWPVCSR